jgi:CRISPR/Cas system-associated exonuclease Cas4 (RecB family)
MELNQKLNQVANEMQMALDAVIQGEADKKGGPADHSKGNWASEIHHPCRRMLTYSRLRWEDRKTKPIESLYRFQEGNVKEDFVVERLAKAGYRIKMQQLRLVWPKYKISGRIDGTINVDGLELPAEVKSISPWFWDTTRTIQQIKEHPKFWIRRIPSQLNLYELMNNMPGGFLIMATFGRPFRILPMLLDYELGEEDLKTCEAVNAAVDRGELLPPIEYENDVCGMCDFEHICQPVKTAELANITEAQAKDAMRLLEIEPVSREYDRLWKKLFGNKENPGPFYKKNAFIDDIEISFTEADQKYIELPETFKPRFTKSRKIVKPKIGRI